MSETETEPVKDVMARLREQFPAEHVGKLPQPFKKESPKGKCKPKKEGGDAPDWQDYYCGGYHGLPAIHLDYVGHAAVTDRLLAVDPEWSWEPLAFDERGFPALDAANNLWIRLTVNGFTRLGVGDGQNMKERIGDALRNAAMRFGVALDLWIKGHEEESKPETRKADADKAHEADAAVTFTEQQAAVAADWFAMTDAQRSALGPLIAERLFNDRSTVLVREDFAGMTDAWLEYVAKAIAKWQAETAAAEAPPVGGGDEPPVPPSAPEPETVTRANAKGRTTRSQREGLRPGEEPFDADPPAEPAPNDEPADTELAETLDGIREILPQLKADKRRMLRAWAAAQGFQITEDGAVDLATVFSAEDAVKILDWLVEQVKPKVTA